MRRRPLGRRLTLAPALLLTLLTALLLVPAAPVTPPGARAAVRVVALGDSVVAGTACDCSDFVEQYAQLLQARAPSRVLEINEGRPGLTADQLVGSLADGSRVAQEVAQADVVVVTVGANDLAPALTAWRVGGCPASCQARAVETMRARLRTALDRVHVLARRARPAVLVTDYWNVFADGDVARRASGAAYLAWSDAITRRANTAICATAHRVGARCVDLYRPFKADGSLDPTDLLADDGDHPDAAGHELIARTLAATPVPLGASADRSRG